MEVHQGRPESMEGRQEREIRCYDFLDELGLTYWQTDHKENAANTMQDCVEIDAVLEATLCKNLFLCNRQQTVFYLLMMPCTKNFKTKELSSQIGSARLSFGNEEQMVELLDIHPGAVSVLGLMNDPENRVNLLVDEDVLKGEFLGCHPCVNSSSVKLYTKDVFERFLPAVHHDYRTVTLVGDHNPMEDAGHPGK